MRFESIQQLIELTGANAKAAECLGKSGALILLEDDLNEIEAAEYARSIVDYLRALKQYEEKLQKYEEQVSTGEERFRKEIEDRRERQEKRDRLYEERMTSYRRKVEEITLENEARKLAGKKLLKLPKQPAELPPLKDVKYPKVQQPPERPSEPTKPRITLSERERIKLQREILHVYLTGHPLDEVPEKEGITTVSDLNSSKEGSWCTIRGVLQSMKVTNTRKKKLMARLRIEDKTGSIEVVAFPKLYESLKGALVEGELYEILGRVDITKRITDQDEESVHTQFIGTSVQRIMVGSDKEWDIMYPLLKGQIRVLPSRKQKSKGLASKIILGRPRKAIEEYLG